MSIPIQPHLPPTPLGFPDSPATPAPIPGLTPKPAEPPIVEAGTRPEPAPLPDPGPPLWNPGKLG